MKLQIQPWPNNAGFMLSVNSHDQVSGLDSGAVDAQAFRELQAENQRLKEAIEEAWDDAGLPTFLRYLRDYIKTRPTIRSATDVRRRARGPGRLTRLDAARVKKGERPLDGSDDAAAGLGPGSAGRRESQFDVLPGVTALVLEPDALLAPGGPEPTRTLGLPGRPGGVVDSGRFLPRAVRWL